MFTPCGKECPYMPGKYCTKRKGHYEEDKSDLHLAYSYFYKTRHPFYFWETDRDEEILEDSKKRELEHSTYREPETATEFLWMSFGGNPDKIGE